ncbi:hypothetical protein QBC34DRAFT_338573 [Podospora aff. communis PSN243]|uniref:Nephrocystin 3-like N-terminal domain-containing protein n=1 Tax=Podospora aff. communis PSN243 TaxID=3040156 RepID=A0AAV9G378_9PEZI|nr:hypothetical protein QBC34DRAFT_338573 [Podospora aff. communis PSN243]
MLQTMAEAIALAASVIAVIQLAERVASICKFYIGEVNDYPKDLRLIYVEVASLKVVFEGLSFFDQDDPDENALLRALQGEDGPIQGCKKVIEELTALLPPDPLAPPSNGRTKREKVQDALACLAWPLKANTAKKLLEGIVQYKTTITMGLQGQLLFDMRQGKRQVEILSVTVNESEWRQLIEWIRGPQPEGTNSWRLNRTAKSLYEEGTGDWVFQTPEWSRWINAQQRAIWLHGIPGAGKTILMSYLIGKVQGICEKLRDEAHVCSYYYCYHSHNQDETEPFLRTIVSDLLARQAKDYVPGKVWRLFQTNTQLDQQSLLSALDELLKSKPPSAKFFVAIDALDESHNIMNLLTLLQVLADDDRYFKMQLLASSRQYEEIRAIMCTISLPLSMSNPFVEADIRVFVASNLEKELRFRRWPHSLRDEVLEAVSVGAQGMFRWAACQLDILRRLHHQSKIKQAIKTLPATLDEMYERIFSTISTEEQDLVRQALHMVCFHDFLWMGHVPLPAQVIFDSHTAFERDHTDMATSDDTLFDMDTLKDLCGCLVTFAWQKGHNGGAETAVVAHYTVREFLESSRSTSPQTAWVKIIFRYGLATRTPPMRTPVDNVQRGSRKDPYAGPLCINSTSSLREYCLASANRTLVSCDNLVEPSLAFQLFNPTAPHYGEMAAALRWLDIRSCGGHAGLAARYGVFPFAGYSLAQEDKHSPAAIFWNLVCFRCHSLAEAFLLSLGARADQALTGRLRAEPIFSDLLERTPGQSLPLLNATLQGNAFQILTQVGFMHRITNRLLSFVQKYGRRYIQDLVLLHVSSPASKARAGPDVRTDGLNRGLGSFHQLGRLLKLGLSPDPPGYQVTPLQILCYKRRLHDIRVLLQAGADPNNTGDPEGVSWQEKGTFLYRYRKLHGILPLDVLTHLDYNYFGDDEWSPRSAIEFDENYGRPVTDEMREVLVSYGARSAKEAGKDKSQGEEPVGEEYA